MNVSNNNSNTPLNKIYVKDVVEQGGATILVIGIPASGKTTFIHEFVKYVFENWMGGGSTFYGKEVPFPISVFAAEETIIDDYRNYARFPYFQNAHKHSVSVSKGTLDEFEATFEKGGLFIVDDLASQFSTKHGETRGIYKLRDFLGLHRHRKQVWLLSIHSVTELTERLRDILMAKITHYVLFSRYGAKTLLSDWLDSDFRTVTSSLKRLEKMQYLVIDKVRYAFSGPHRYDDIEPIMHALGGLLQQSFAKNEEIMDRKFTAVETVAYLIKRNPDKPYSEIGEVMGGLSPETVARYVQRARRFGLLPRTLERAPSGKRAKIIQLLDANVPYQEIAEQADTTYDYVKVVASAYKRSRE